MICEAVTTYLVQASPFASQERGAGRCSIVQGVFLHFFFHNLFTLRLKIEICFPGYWYYITAESIIKQFGMIHCHITTVIPAYRYITARLLLLPKARLEVVMMSLCD